MSVTQDLLKRLMDAKNYKVYASGRVHKSQKSLRGPFVLDGVEFYVSYKTGGIRIYEFAGRKIWGIIPTVQRQLRGAYDFRTVVVPPYDSRGSLEATLLAVFSTPGVLKRMVDVGGCDHVQWTTMRQEDP